MTSYWGEYKWPVPEYPRFGAPSDLEQAGDQTSVMRAAFHWLKGVEELALSMTSGLGWLHGPDVSLYSRVFKRPLEVFGSRYEHLDVRAEGQQRLWDALKRMCPEAYNLGILSSMAVQNTTFKMSGDAYRRLAELEDGQPGGVRVPTLRGLFDDRGSSMTEAIADDDAEDDGFVGGIISVAPTNPEDSPELLLIPRKLTRAQLEWLVEIEWAQRAFLLSYVVSVIDNPTAFANVHTFNVARLPSHLLEQLERADFWDGMSQLTSVTVLVGPQWRAVSMDEERHVWDEKVPLRRSVASFENLIMNVLAVRSNIKTLNIGWAAGGEHEPGIFGRNQHVMPTPVMLESFIASSFQNREDIVFLPHVRDLTLTNCWIIPWTLVRFVAAHAAHGVLTSLTLDSLSLTGQYMDHVVRPTEYQPVKPRDVPMPAAITELLAAMGPLPPRLPWLPANRRPRLRGPDPSMPPMRDFVETIEHHRETGGWDDEDLGQHTTGEDLPYAPRWDELQPVCSWPWVLDAIDPARAPTDDDDEEGGGKAKNAGYANGTEEKGRVAAKNLLPRSSSLRRLALRSCGYAAVVNSSAARTRPRRRLTSQARGPLTTSTSRAAGRRVSSTSSAGRSAASRPTWPP